MDTLAARSRQIGELLDEAPGTFTAGERVLRHFGRTSTRLERLSRTFAPGAKELRALAPVSNRVTGTLATTTPRFAELLRTSNRALPDIARFIERSEHVLPTAGKALSGVTDGIACVRPYAPELAGYLSTMAAAHASYDANGHYIRFGLATYPGTTPSTMTPAEMMARFPRLHYAMVRPPGINVGQPWFQPECGVTPAGLDPVRDLEAGG
jgi:ABC-type transporter Mla subunit MlaD